MRLDAQTRQVSLKDIHGSDVPFVWVQIARPMDFDERSPAVLIVGSAVELADRTMAIASESQLEKECQAIAAILARQGLHLVADACPGIPNLVERAYLPQPSRGVVVDLSVLRIPDELQTPRAYSPTGFPAGGDVLLFCGTGFEVLSIINTYCADVVLVVGGGLGSLMEGIIAVVNDLPVVCYSPAGGVAGEMQALFERYRSRYKHLRIDTVCTLADLDAYLAAFAEEFRQAQAVSQLGSFLSTLQPAPQQSQDYSEIRIESDLKHISYCYRESSIELSQPVLAIDDVRILDHAATGVAIRSYLESMPRRYKYDGVTIHVPAGILNLVWCPSIDTFSLLRTIRPHLNRHYGNALDIGTGTGAIALWLAATNRADEVFGIDKNAEAVRCAAINAAGMRIDDRCKFQTVRYEDFRRGAPAFQLVTCNPPYVPRLAGQELEDGSFEGVNLVIELLSALDSILAADGVCFLGLSSTSWTDPTVRSLMLHQIEEQRAALLYEAAVPFKVADVLLDPQWLRQLLEGGGIFLDADARYAYWHRIQIWKLVRNPSLLAAEPFNRDTGTRTEHPELCLTIPAKR